MADGGLGSRWRECQFSYHRLAARPHCSVLTARVGDSPSTRSPRPATPLRDLPQRRRSLFQPANVLARPSSINRGCRAGSPCSRTGATTELWERAPGFRVRGSLMARIRGSLMAQSYSNQFAGPDETSHQRVVGLLPFRSHRRRLLRLARGLAPRARRSPRRLQKPGAAAQKHR